VHFRACRSWEMARKGDNTMRAPNGRERPTPAVDASRRKAKGWRAIPMGGTVTGTCDGVRRRRRPARRLIVAELVRTSSDEDLA
jgi:hypothetical protein